MYRCCPSQASINWIMMMQKDIGGNPEYVVFHYSNLEIPIHVYYENRERMRLTVWPDKQVVVKAPKDRNRQEVHLKIMARLPWIHKQLTYFDQYQPVLPEPRYVSGETHFYLGRQYRLKIVPHRKNSVKLIGKFFLLTTNQPESKFN